MEPLKLPVVIAEEKIRLRERRKRLNQVHGSDDQENWFGIALSGGGIRSATINMGFLRTLSRFGILRRADYLSTVSGGGYTHAYVQGTLKNSGKYEELFSDTHAAEFRQHGEYMTPGRGFGKNRNLFLLIVAFLVSWIMSLISLIIAGGIVYFLYEAIAGFVGGSTLNELLSTDSFSNICTWYVYALAALLAVHFAVNVWFTFDLGLSKTFNRIEALLAALGLGLLTWMLLLSLTAPGAPGQVASEVVKAGYVWWKALAFIVGLVGLGFLANPNALSFHRFYRKQLADLFLRFSGTYKNVLLRDLANVDSEREADFLAPYPLINTCMNLQNPSGDDKFKGVKASDYFVLSPLFCGSKLTGYAPTTQYRDFRCMTLPAAVTISAAAVNPGLGIYSSKLRSAIFTLFNARLGFWVSNPFIRTRTSPPVWWPFYFFSELLGRIGIRKQMVNISDGGHIENFGAYELLRRGCRLVIAVDAGEDRLFTFEDLNNLILRARNELGLEIRFKAGQAPEDLIAPRPSQVYSQKRFAVAEVIQHWDDGKVDVPKALQSEPFPRKIGTFVYVKSSVTAPSHPPPDKPDADLKYSTYFYKIYHPEFPHESTGDQFFDPVQWESYYRLGQYLGADALGLNDLSKAFRGNEKQISVEQLIAWFDAPESNGLFTEAEQYLAAQPDKGFESIKIGETKSGQESVAREPAAPAAEEEVCRM